MTDPEPDLDATGLLHRLMPFAGHVGLVALRSPAGLVHLRLPWRADLCTVDGVLHGGVIATGGDCAAAAVASLGLPAGATGTTTVETGVHFFRPVRAGHAAFLARILHGGRRTIVAEVVVRDAAGREVARQVQTQAVLW